MIQTLVILLKKKLDIFVNWLISNMYALIDLYHK